MKKQLLAIASTLFFVASSHAYPDAVARILETRLSTMEICPDGSYNSACNLCPDGSYGNSCDVSPNGGYGGSNLCPDGTYHDSCGLCPNGKYGC